LRKWGVLDFAGGTVVHISAGFAALSGAIFLGKRKDGGDSNPTNIPYILLGAGLLWFGWFGFNAGSALAANEVAVSAFLNTNLASATAMVAWLLMDGARGKKRSAVGAAIAAVVGLVAITPAAGFVNAGQSIFIGFVASMVSYFAVRLKSRSSIDDTLDVFPCHGLGGITGMILDRRVCQRCGIDIRRCDRVSLSFAGAGYRECLYLWRHIPALQAYRPHPAHACHRTAGREGVGCHATWRNSYRYSVIL